MYPRLKTLRKSLGMTQEEFGKSLNIAKSTYNNYETGIRDPKSDFWITVAKKYGVTVDYLMGHSDDPHQTSDSEKFSKEEKERVKKYRALDEYGKGTVDTILDREFERCQQQTQSAQKPKLYLMRMAGRDGIYKEVWLTDEEADALDAKISDLESAADI